MLFLSTMATGNHSGLVILLIWNCLGVRLMDEKNQR